MSIKSNNYKLTRESGLIACVISNHVKGKINRKPVLPEPEDNDPETLFLSGECSAVMCLLKYADDDFCSLQKLKQAFSVWSSLPEEDRLQILTAFIRRSQAAFTGKRPKDAVYTFCRFFLTELVPVLSVGDN